MDSILQWLSYSFSRNSQGELSGGHLNILENSSGSIKDHACSLDESNYPPTLVNPRIVVLYCEESWALDRDVLDKATFSLNLPPFFLWHHLEYEANRNEKAYPGDLRGLSSSRPYPAPSKVQSRETGWTLLFYVSGMVAFPATTSAGATCKTFRLGKAILNMTDSRLTILVRTRRFRLNVPHSAQIPGPANVSPSNLSNFHWPKNFGAPFVAVLLLKSWLQMQSRMTASVPGSPAQGLYRLSIDGHRKLSRAFPNHQSFGRRKLREGYIRH